MMDRKNNHMCLSKSPDTFAIPPTYKQKTHQLFASTRKVKMFLSCCCCLLLVLANLTFGSAEDANKRGESKNTKNTEEKENLNRQVKNNLFLRLLLLRVHNY